MTAQDGSCPLSVDLLAMAEVAQEGIVSKTIVESDRLKLVHFTFAPGQELSEHTASVPATIQVLSGNGSVLLGDERHEARAGSLFYMPAQLRHAVRADDELVFLLTLFRG